MYRVPPDRAWWPAVGARLERGVRLHGAGGGEVAKCAEIATNLCTRGAPSCQAALVMTFQPPLPMLSEARVLPVAAADKLTLDNRQLGKKRFP